MGRPKGDEGSVISRGKTMAAIYGEDRVNYFTNDYQYNPAVSGLLGGGYVVTWVSPSHYTHLPPLYPIVLSDEHRERADELGEAGV